MLCPEVWDFKAPKHHFEIEHSRIRKSEICQTIKNHYFNHSVSVVLPHSNDVPATLLDSILEDTDYYKVEGLSVFQLIDKEFIEAFVKKGELSLLSINVRIDLDNVICLTPEGILILSLLVEDFQSLGIEGKPSYFDRKIPTRYVVKVDLKEDAFTPGKKKYDRVRGCLENNFKQKFDIVLAWDPPEEKMCPSSVASWFHNRGNKVSVCHQRMKKQTHYSINIPIPEGNYDVDAFFEWIGILSINGDMKNEDEENYVNSYVCPKPNIPKSDVAFVEFTGFQTRSKIAKIHDAVEQLAMSEESKAPWISLHAHGFADSPVNWSGKEHSYYTDGDNSFTTVFQPNGEHILQKSLSSNNKPRIFQ